MTFERPWLLALVVLAPLGFALLRRRAESLASARALAYSQLSFVIGAVGERNGTQIERLLLGGWLAALAVAGVAAAGPIADIRLPARDGAIVLCLDRSGSMRARDVTPSRALAEAAAARAFAAALPAGARLAIVGFSSTASVVAPLSADRAVAVAGIEALPDPGGGTAIGDALDLAQRLLPREGRRAVVVLTDGVNNQGADPLESAARLGRAGVIVDTVGIGTSTGGSLASGETASLDEDALREIATEAGGAYVRVADASLLERTFARLAGEVAFRATRVDLTATLAFAVVVTVVALSLLDRFVESGAFAGRASPERGGKEIP